MYSAGQNYLVNMIIDGCKKNKLLKLQTGQVLWSAWNSFFDSKHL